MALQRNPLWGSRTEPSYAYRNEQGTQRKQRTWSTDSGAVSKSLSVPSVTVALYLVKQLPLLNSVHLLILCLVLC